MAGLLDAQQFPLIKNEKLNISKLRLLKDKDTPNYSVTTPKGEHDCKKIIMKKDQSSFYYCTLQNMVNIGKYEYSEIREYSEDIDGFQCIVSEYYHYDSSGNVMEYTKYLTKTPALTNLHIELFPLEEKHYKNGKLISSQKTLFTQKLHNIIIAAISVYHRDKAGMQGHEGVGITNFDSYNVIFKNTAVETQKKEPGDPEISRSEISKAFSSLKADFSIYRTSYRNIDEPDEWIITFSRDKKEFTISVDDKTGNGTVSRNNPKDIWEVI